MNLIENVQNWWYVCPGSMWSSRTFWIAHTLLLIPVAIAIEKSWKFTIFGNYLISHKVLEISIIPLSISWNISQLKLRRFNQNGNWLILNRVTPWRLITIHVQHCDIMRFTVLHNRPHKVPQSISFFMHCKTLTILLRIRAGGHFVMSITKNRESHYVTVLDNPLDNWINLRIKETHSKWIYQNLLIILLKRNFK